VLPVYVSVGLAWESAELAMVDRLLASPVFAGRVDPLARVEFTMRDVYPPTHWAIRGVPPAYDTPDEDVYLTGRNLVLLTKAGVVAAKSGANRIALGPLAGNPFPDARPAFFRAMSDALSLGLDHAIEIVTPFVTWEKEEVITLGVELKVPLELTLSCMNPVMPGPLHCGLCSKCRERRDAFDAAGVSDPAPYANPSPRLR
jgi:7-cyano-7-deazaguanine synthase